MSTDSSFKCSQCHTFKASGDFGTRPRDDRYGSKGDRLSLCLSCSATNSANRKRKRTENNPGHPAKRVAATQPLLSSSDFAAALAKHASTTKIDDSWRVSVDETTLTGKEIANHLVSLVWKATGYRFSYALSPTFTLRFTAHSYYFTQPPQVTYNSRWFNYAVHLSMLSGPRHCERHAQEIVCRQGEGKDCSPYGTL